MKWKEEKRERKREGKREGKREIRSCQGKICQSEDLSKRHRKKVTAVEDQKNIR